MKEEKVSTQCHAECGFESNDCEFCRFNSARAIVGDEEAWEKWFEKAKKILGKEPTSRQAFRAAWLLKEKK
jgi:hypothetical protein